VAFVPGTIVVMGYDWSSGDKDNTDGRHQTFFQMLPTARQYALTPFFDQMNIADAFVQVRFTPLSKLTTSAEVHLLSANSSRDLLYSGGGAGRTKGQFGFAVTALSGSHYIGCLPQLTLSYDFQPLMNTSLFVGHLSRGSALEGSTTQHDVTYGFVELTLKYS